ncbi:MAG: YciI family protein [Proteobacteria bacterium]|nr:YciI family protein [Pseudomonadota bacterium]
MLYAIIWEDVQDSLELRKAARPMHLERMNELIAEGRLVIGGPFPAIDAEDPGPAGYTGSVIIAEFASLAAAEQWIDEDPYAKAGIFRKLSVKPFIQVVP